MCEHHVTRRNDDDSYDESWEETDVEGRQYVCACGRDMTQFEKTVNKNNLSVSEGVLKTMKTNSLLKNKIVLRLKLKSKRK